MSIRVRLPSNLATTLANRLPASMSTSLAIRKALDSANEDPTVLVKAFERRFGTPKDPEVVTTTFAASQDYKEGIKRLAEHTHLGENDVCVLALEAYVHQL